MFLTFPLYHVYNALLTNKITSFTIHDIANNYKHKTKYYIQLLFALNSNIEKL